MSRVFRHTIDVIRAPAAEDRRGNTTRDWGTATETPIPRWAIDTEESGDLGDGRTGSTSRWVIRGPYEADIVASDRVRLLGILCEIDGDVLRQPGPSRRTSHTIVRLTRVEG